MFKLIFNSRQIYLGTAFAYGLCWAVMTIVSLVYMVTVANLDPLQMVLVGTVLELSVFIFEIPTGIVADVYSRRRSIIIGYLLLGGGYILLGFTTSFWIILLSQVIWGAGATFLSGARKAWLSDEIGEQKANQTFLRSAQYSQFGYFLGIGISVVLATVNLALPIIVGSIGMMSIGIFCMLFMVERNFSPALTSTGSAYKNMFATFKLGVAEVKKHHFIVMILLIAVVGGLFSEGYDRLNVAYLITHFSFPQIAGLDTVVWWGVLAGLTAICSIIALQLLQSFVDTANKKQVIIYLALFTLLLSLAVIWFALSAQFYWALAAYLSVAALRTVAAPLTTAWLNQGLNPQTRATVLSMHAQADALGQVVGGPGIGAIAKYFSLPLALILSGVLLLPALIIYRLAWRRLLKPRKQTVLFE